jgi:hypothetical protein
MKDDTSLTLLKNSIPNETLYVISVISNPCNFESRYKLANDYIKRMRKFKQIKLYMVELVYGKQEYRIKHEPTIRLRTDSQPLWVKENLINIGIKHLPSDWKYVAWIDADIEFNNPYWSTDTLKLLNGYKDILQLWETTYFLDKMNKPIETDYSMGYLYCKNVVGKYRHPGYAWACTRKAYETLGYIHDESILGSGDMILACALMGKNHIDSKYDPTYTNLCASYVEKAKRLRLGYTPGSLSHYYHGPRSNRGYCTRYKLLIKYRFSPMIHIAYENSGLLCPSIYFPVELLDEISKYFMNRKEDD